MTKPAANTVPSEMPLIRIRDLKKSFGEQLILKGLDLDIPRGSVCVILGGSGMGKSVLLGNEEI